MPTEPGRKYAEAVAELARKAGAEKVVIVAVPSDFPSAWDLADSPPPGWDLAGLRKLLDAAAFGENLTLPDFETVLDRAAALDPIAVRSAARRAGQGAWCSRENAGRPK